jgi:hypothetical protein
MRQRIHDKISLPLFFGMVDATTISIVFGTSGLSRVLRNPSNNNKFICPSMMKVPGTCHVGSLSHCQWINNQR